MPPIGILIKPASSNCSLRCKYCFYRSVSESRCTSSYGIMSIDTLESIVQKTLNYAHQVCTFAFQGGEPTLAGLDFFEKLIEFVSIYNQKNIAVNYSLQTNGIFIDEEWAKFLAQNNFLVGISLDGPKDVHNAHRIDDKNDGTFNKVMKAIKLFNKFKVQYNILSVVTAQSARYVNKTYTFFKQNKFKYIQFINCLDPLNETRGQYPYSLKPLDLEKFLKQIFDRWYEDFINGDYVSIRYFDNILSIIMGHNPESCNMNGRCQCQCVVEADGGVYPCDFYVIDKWRLGNINEIEIEDVMNCEKAKEFVENSLVVNDECKKCKWYALCRGGCRRERDDFSHDNIGLNYYCSAYKAFFNYAYPRFLNVARLIYRK